MKIGFNLLLWTAHVQPEHWLLLEEIKRCGYDGVEIPVFEGSPAHYAELGRELERVGLEATGIALFPSLDMNPIGADPAQRAAGLRHMAWILECTAAMGGRLVGGPLHSTLGHFSGEAPTREERERGIEFHRAAGDVAGRLGVRVAIEALNRFECYFLNTMSDLAAYLDAVDHPNITGMYDTFHANIEEKDPIGAVAAIRRHLGHMHVSENDRGTPGRGHIDFAATFEELKRSGYDGWITIEAFGRALPPLAAATRVWRDFFPTPREVYSEGYGLIRRGWDAARA
ncbi:sugar phosphate isomerase/epimerase family protein [Labrys monachus]|uniref:D-psicose/D-tagatose/L-ribulose 3-epimerase n=1 Tax=Labrys monachus TaxID=217067 RepID=A0ABU0FBJ0_9HYPH|nr:sugar phosphate isomerase/epimerase [Labrys monachus]MDQ0391975.1 D-psicose/D-tagatose/L-ribulose 3-epimerase [Labrys monachus]